MQKLDYRDIIGGLLLVCVGTSYAAYSYSKYDLGAIARMGPGMFPLGLGIILATLGAVLLVQAFRRPGKWPTFNLLEPLLVLTGIVVFGLTIRPLGLIPAICLLIVIVSPAEGRLRPRAIAGLCIFISVICWLIFSVGLGLPVRMFWWGS